MPEETEKSAKIVELVKAGNENVHLYDDVLIAYAGVQRLLAEEAAAKNLKTAKDTNDGLHGKKKKKKKKA